MTTRRLLPFVPSGHEDLLIRAAIAPMDIAQPAWQAWASRRSLDDACWAEVRMLPTVAARSGELGIAADLQPRLDGIRRYVWAKCQKKSLAARPALILLNSHGIPYMLLKGAAIMAGWPDAVGRRYLRDVDVLVPKERIEEAIALLWEAGWHSACYANPTEARLLALARSHALSLSGPEDGELDLHRFALSPNFLAGDDDGFWQRAEQGRFLGLPCRLPSKADLLVATLEHSVRRDPDHVLDWSLDAARLIGSDGLDWRVLVDEVRQRCLSVPVEARLRYLKDRCGLAVPSPVLDDLAETSDDKVFVDEYLSKQYKGLRLPVARRQAKLRGQLKRIAKFGGLSGLAGLDLSGRTRPEVIERVAGRRIDVVLPQSAIQILKVEVIVPEGYTKDWRCLVNSGPVTLLRLVGGNDLMARLRRRFFSRANIVPGLFAAQGLDRLSLFILGRTLAEQPCTPVSVSCEATMLKPNELLIRLRLGV